MLCLSGFELYSRWVPLYILLNQRLFLYIMIIPQYTERIALLVNYF